MSDYFKFYVIQHKIKASTCFVRNILYLCEKETNMIDYYINEKFKRLENRLEILENKIRNIEEAVIKIMIMVAIVFLSVAIFFVHFKL